MYKYILYILFLENKNRRLFLETCVGAEGVCFPVFHSWEGFSRRLASYQIAWPLSCYANVLGCLLLAAPVQHTHRQERVKGDHSRRRGNDIGSLWITAVIWQTAGRWQREVGEDIFSCLTLLFSGAERGGFEKNVCKKTPNTKQSSDQSTRGSTGAIPCEAV